MQSINGEHTQHSSTVVYLELATPQKRDLCADSVLHRYHQQLAQDTNTNREEIAFDCPAIANSSKNHHKDTDIPGSQPDRLAPRGGAGPSACRRTGHAL